MPEPLTISVPACALTSKDLIVRDPDDPDTGVHWQIQSAHTDEDRVRIVDYVTEDDTEGRHAFTDPSQWVTVAIREHKSAA